MEAIHVELPDEASKVGVLEEPREELATKPVRRRHLKTGGRVQLRVISDQSRGRTKERVAIFAPADQIVGCWVVDHPVKKEGRTSEVGLPARAALSRQRGREQKTGSPRGAHSSQSSPSST